MVASLLGFLEAAVGRHSVGALLAHLPGSPTVASLTRHDRWFSRQEFAELVALAEQITNDDRIGRQVGYISYRAVLNSPNADLLRSLGSVHEAMVAMADYSSKMSTGRRFEAARTSEHVVTITGVYDAGVTPHQYSCDVVAGFFAALPGLFDCGGTAVEVECQGRGDPRCVYRVSWFPDPDTTDRRIGEGVVPGISSLELMEGYHHAAAELVKATDVNDVLDRVVRQVSSTVKAPSFLISVRLPGDAAPRIHQTGFDDDVATQLAEALDGTGGLPQEAAVAPIEQDGRPVGHLVALMPAGTTASRHDERTLRSFAGYAGSALSIVAALERAQDARDTATALLDLARSLAAANDVDEVAERLVATIHHAIDADLTTMWAFDQEAEAMRLVAARGREGERVELGTDVLDTSLADVGALVRDRTPQLVETARLAPQERELMDRHSLVEAVLIPIVVRDAVIGMATAGFCTAVPDERRRALPVRLRGMADQAAIAFENAHLIGQIRHQALHDDLTGLPKRALAVDRCATALARRARTGETVAVLFVDLDGFKQVNDTSGHAVGDELLCTVADRLRGVLRASDTCARMGGDEFVVVLSDLADTRGAVEVAERIIATMAAPFLVGGRRFEVTCSVGIAVAGEHDTDVEELLTRSDDAMYRAKDAGRNTYALGG